MPRPHRSTLTALATLLLLSACGSATASTTATPPPGQHALTGTFRLTSGACSSSQSAPPSGSYFAMLSGSSLSGPFVANGTASDAGGAKCANQDYTPLLAGSDGGLRTGAFQPNPAPAFDAAGNGLAGLIAKPASFFGTAFALSTQATDPQTHTTVPAPSITENGGALSGDLRALSAAWNSGFYNQGAPKPDGSHPGITSALSGTIACDGSFTLTWASTIVGGPFNGFTGAWHLTGSFVPATGSAAQALGCSS